ncbi:MAG: Holliday junction resolvase RuvX [Gammaproteobacteria bacterium]
MRKDAKVVLSLDYGTKKIGICIAETYTGQTKPLPIVKNDKFLHKSLDALVEEWKPNLLLIGMPPKMTEEFNLGLSQLKDFFSNKHNLKALDVDEDYTSQSLDNSKKNDMKDSFSAELIFQDWFNNNYG